MNFCIEDQEKKMSQIRRRIQEGYYLSHDMMKLIVDKFLKEQGFGTERLTLTD